MKKILLAAAGCILAVNGFAYAIQNKLVNAIIAGDPELVKRELRSRAYVNERGYEGDTPLHYAVQYDETKDMLEIVNMLLNAGADISVKNDAGRNPFEEAIFKHNYQAASLIVKHYSKGQSSRKKIKALLGAQGPRTGAHSPAQPLTQDMYQHIYELLKKSEQQ